MPEKTQTMNAEKRNADETAKELLAFFPIATFSRASSSLPDDETHKQRTHSTKRARIAKTRAEAPQDVSSPFLRARMVGVRGENEERMLMTKDDKRKFYFARCSPHDANGSQRETRRVVWETLMS